MEISNLNIPVENTPTAANTQPVETGIPPSPPTPSTPVIPNQPPEESKKPILLLIIGAFLVLAVVGGIFLYINSRQTRTNVQTMQTPAPTPEENLESELNSIDVDSTGSSEIDQLDQDLQQL